MRQWVTGNIKRMISIQLCLQAKMDSPTITRRSSKLILNRNWLSWRWLLWKVTASWVTYLMKSKIIPTLKMKCSTTSSLTRASKRHNPSRWVLLILLIKKWWQPYLTRLAQRIHICCPKLSTRNYHLSKSKILKKSCQYSHRADKWCSL